MSKKRVRNICFTLNHPVRNGGLKLWHDLESISSYYVIGYERGKNGTDHWQGYAELVNQMAFEKVCRMGSWHIEMRKGTAKQAANYCKKDGEYVEWGVISNQGGRTDIVALKELTLTHGLAEVAKQATSYQEYRLAEIYYNYHAPPRDPMKETEVIFITGPSGAGKSKLAYEMLKDKSYYVKDEGPWWTGYNGEPWVLLDDFRSSWMTHNQFIKLLDRYPMRVRVHGGLTEMRATGFIITSCLPLESLYSSTPDEPRAQILRRVKKIITVALPEVDRPPASAAANFSEDGIEYSEVGVILHPTSSEHQNADDITNVGDY